MIPQQMQAALADLVPDSQVPAEPEIRTPHPEPTSEEERLRFLYRHNYPYRRKDGRRQQLLGDFGVREERRTTTTTTLAPSTTASTTAAPLNAAGPFVTMDQGEVREEARQPKDYDYGADSKMSEVRVLPPKEFRHLLAQVDGVAERRDDTATSEQRLRPSRRTSKKFHGVPGTAGRDFPTLASIPMTSFSCIGTQAGFYADLEANCQVRYYLYHDRTTSPPPGLPLLPLRRSPGQFSLCKRDSFQPEGRYY